MYAYSRTCQRYIFLYTKLTYIFLYAKLTALRIIQRGPFELLYCVYAGTQTNFEIAENSWYAFSNYVNYTVAHMWHLVPQTSTLLELSNILHIRT